MTYKEPLCFIAGAIVGAAGCYFAMKQRCDSNVNAAWEESRHYYNKKVSELSRKNRNKPDPTELINNKLPDDVETVVKEGKTDYTEYATMTKEDPECIEADEEPDIYQITEEDWMYDRDYEKVTTIIYADGIIANDDDDDILDIEDTIGSGGYDAGLHNTNPNRGVYIRNTLRSIDYEIVTSDRSYTEATGIYIGGEARD